MICRPVELRAANAFVREHHRHHQPVQGHRFSLSAWVGAELVGVAIIGRPVARGCDPASTVEVTRLCTNGTKNACSFLYAAAARAAAALGYETIQTYILDWEPGTSLRAAGWARVATVAGRQWEHSTERQLRLDGHTRRIDQPTEAKQRWAKVLRS